MALIEALPLFIPKFAAPGEVRPTILAPRVKKDTDTKPIVLTTDNVTSEDKGIIDETKNTDSPKIGALPDVYSGLDPLAQALNDSIITNPNARAAVLAQMGSETTWGTKVHDFNYGNITKGSSWAGNLNARGDKDADGNSITQNFRTYSSAKEFLDDYVKLLQRTYPDAYHELTSNDFNIDRFTSGLLDGKFRYAESRSYASDIARVYRSVLKRLGIK